MSAIRALFPRDQKRTTDSEHLARSSRRADIDVGIPPPLRRATVPTRPLANLRGHDHRVYSYAVLTPARTTSTAGPPAHVLKCPSLAKDRAAYSTNSRIRAGT